MRIQWLPKGRNPANTGDDSRGNGTAGKDANAVMDTRAHLGVGNMAISITAPKVWVVLKEKRMAL